MEAIVPLLVGLPLAGAFAVVAMAHFRYTKALTAPLTGLVVLANLAISLALLSWPLGSLYVGGWTPAKALGIELVCDGLAKMMLIIVNLVSLSAILFAGAYMKRFTKVWLFESLFLLMLAGMNGVLLAGDLFNLFVFIEVSAIASYALVGFGCEAEELEAAFKYLVLGTVGSAFILVGVTILY
ncbi:MAG: hypothetical protein HQ546_01230, partial [Planctomycetes bacterium]|nr:hypothetical protein [Planctomycetota bacterium]